MISALFPAFLAAGAVLAITPIVLHLLARRPPDRVPLPTARFLREDARTLLRLQRRPTDLVLLGVRVLFALSLGAALAGMTWTSARTGSGRVVLLDAGADPQADWGAARAIAQREAEPGASGNTSEGSIILAYGLDDGFRPVAPGELGSLRRGSRPATAEDALRALRRWVLSETLWQSAGVTWVTRPSWRAWSPGIGVLRPALWPGSVDLRPVLDGTPMPEMTPSEGIEGTLRPTALILGATAEGPLWRALAALGVDVSAAATATRPDWIFIDSPTNEERAAYSAEVRAGTTVVVSGRLVGDTSPDRNTQDAAFFPWAPGTAEERDRGRIVLETGVTLDPPAVEGGSPTAGASVVAAFEDVTPAAAAVAVGEGCVVYLAASINDPALVGSPDFPSLVEALGHACVDIGDVDGPLDRGALHALERTDLPTYADLSEMAGSEGSPLSRWLTLLALMLLVAEVGLTRIRRP